MGSGKVVVGGRGGRVASGESVAGEEWFQGKSGREIVISKEKKWQGNSG